jgi:hypothetical protein
MSLQEWIPPPWKDLNFTRDCEKYGWWLSSLLTPDTWLGDMAYPLDLNYFRSYHLLLSAIPTGYPEPNATQAAIWWMDVTMAYFDAAVCNPQAMTALCNEYVRKLGLITENIYNPGVVHCTPEVCRALARSGNPDLAGLGVRLALI